MPGKGGRYLQRILTNYFRRNVFTYFTLPHEMATVMRMLFHHHLIMDLILQMKGRYPLKMKMA